MIERTYFVIQHSHNLDQPNSVWDNVEEYDLYSTALNRARVMVTREPGLIGKLRLVRCQPLNANAITPIVGLHK